MQLYKYNYYWSQWYDYVIYINELAVILNHHKMTKIFYFGLFILLVLGCKNYPENYQPKDLFDAIEYLDYTWDDNEREKYKNMPEDSAVTMLHFGTGMGLRNNWNLWSGENSLSKYFNSIGIFHPDDMSSIILTSLHRRLNEKDIDLQGQINFYLNYWRESREQIEFRKLRAQKEFNKYKIGDKVTIYMEVDSVLGEKRAIGCCPDSSWKFNPDKDLFLRGIVLDKFVNADSNYIFKLKITKINRPEIPTLYEIINKNDIVDIEIIHFKIEK